MYLTVKKSILACYFSLVFPGLWQLRLYNIKMSARQEMRINALNGNPANHKVPARYLYGCKDCKTSSNFRFPAKGQENSLLTDKTETPISCDLIKCVLLATDGVPSCACSTTFRFIFQYDYPGAKYDKQ